MELANPLIHKFNALAGFFIAILSYFLGSHWFLFASFLALNVLDWLTGWMKSTLTNRKNSSKGAKGVLKKLGYWLMICLAFGSSAVFIEIGKTIGVDLHITTLLGWFVLASLIVNEIRSIIENFVEAGYNVPDVLTKGLEVAEQVIEKNAEIGSILVDRDEEKITLQIPQDVPIDEIVKQGSVSLKVEDIKDIRT